MKGTFQEVGKDIQKTIQTSSARTNERIDASLHLQAQLCAGNGLPCPRRFVLFEANPDGSLRPWRHPREWFRSTKSVKLYLYFVCSYSNRLVDDANRIKLRYTKEQLKKIAPAFNASLSILQLATPLVKMAPIAGTAAISSTSDKILEKSKLKEMEEWSRDLLEPNDKVLLAEARKNGNVIKNGDVQTLIGPGLSLFAEKAAEKENLGWLDELTAAYDFQEKEATFINRKYLSEKRYKKWQASENLDGAADELWA